MQNTKKIFKNKISHGMKTLLSKVPYLIIAILVGFTISYAGSLTAPGSVANTMYSLTDIFNLSTNTTTTLGSGTIPTTPGSVVATGKTLTEVYDALATEIGNLSSSVIASGTTAFGIAGDSDVVDTSSGDAVEADIADGKIAWVDGVEVTGTATAGPATLTWQTDPSLTSLCWSHNQYEIDNGCSVGSGFIDASIAQDGSIPLGTVEYCQYLNTNGTTLAETPVNYWHLPTIAEYQSITDFSAYNNATQVSGFAGFGNYWSSTVFAGNADVAWFWYDYTGFTYIDNKNLQKYARCVR